MNRFAIVAHRRTGSNHLVKLLDSHPNLICFGEIFRNFYDVKHFFPELENTFANVNTRIEHYDQFLDAIHAKVLPSGKAGWSFKLMPFQVVDCLSSILANKIDKVIILRRDNQLAQFSSDLIAAETGQGVACKDSEVKTAQVHFSPREFDHFCKNVDSNYDRVFEILKYLNKPVLEIEYMELQDKDLHKRLSTFLEVEHVPLQSGHKKRNSPIVIDRFSNYNAVRDYLFKKGLNKFAVEAKSC